jgi:hypothetical protein
VEWSDFMLRAYRALFFAVTCGGAIALMGCDLPTERPKAYRGFSQEWHSDCAVALLRSAQQNRSTVRANMYQLPI